VQIGVVLLGGCGILIWTKDLLGHWILSWDFDGGFTHTCGGRSIRALEDCHDEKSKVRAMGVGGESEPQQKNEDQLEGVVAIIVGLAVPPLHPVAIAAPAAEYVGGAAVGLLYSN
jgi:hypothetical protein